MEFYNKMSEKYFNETINVNMSEHYNKFLPYLNPNSKILDLGCGSGRDSKFFLENGFNVDSLDKSGELSLLASNYIGKEVINMDMKNINFYKSYDAIWCSASLLHIMPDELKNMLLKIKKSLNRDGYLYLSLKKGFNDIVKADGRTTVLYNEIFIKALLESINFKIKECYFTKDSMSREIDWINIIAQK